MKEELQDRIDGVVASASASKAPAGSDIDPDGLEAQLRLWLPAHTYFEVMPTFIHAEGCDQAEQIPVTSVEVGWSTPDGMWAAIGVPDPDQPESGLHLVRIKGPNTRVDRSGLTVAGIIDLLRAVGAISPAP